MPDVEKSASANPGASSGLGAALWVAGVLGAIIGGVATLLFMSTRIESLVADHVGSAGFAREFAEVVRPFAVFDQNEAVLIDRGAMAHIDSIRVAVVEDSGLPKSIRVVPKHHLVDAPILEGLTPEVVQFTARRGRGLDWIYDVYFVMYEEELEDPRKFRIEVIP